MFQENKKKRNKDCILEWVDCWSNVYQEKIKDQGEDAFVRSLNSRALLVGVFDGCGGAGAKRYPKLQDKTGAYVASRMISGTVRDWFQAACFRGDDFSAQELKDLMRENLTMCYQVGGEASRFVSSMVKSFPTTAAFAVCSLREGKIQVDCFWAGDSRVYLLNADGLTQLSRDDLTVPDAMDNLYEDGVMTNMISQSRDFTLHHGYTVIDQPGIVFAATDGCFGYLPTPMDFEYMLVSLLAGSESMDQWEKLLHSAIGTVAGDDYSLSAVVLGYGSFRALQEFASGRAKFLRENYTDSSQRERQEKYDLWSTYKPGYYGIALEMKE